MNLTKFICLGFLILWIGGCDEVSRVTPDQKSGDIVWVGNGLRLESSHGVLVDIEDADLGRQSLLMTLDHLLPVVRSEENNSVPVRFDWSASSPNSSPIVQLQILGQETSKCKRYEAHEEELVCNDNLDALSIKEGTVPAVLADGAFLYLDIFNSLHYFNSNKEDLIISGGVDEFIVNDSALLLARSMETKQWTCFQAREARFEVCETGLNGINQFYHFIKSASNEILAVGRSALGHGVYKLLSGETNIEFQLLQKVEPDWEWRDIGESNDVLKMYSETRGEFWIRITENAYEFLELPRVEETKALALQSVREFSIAKTAQEQGFSFQLCRSELANGDENPPISKCTYLKRSDSYEFIELLLHYPNELERPQLISISKRKDLGSETDLNALSRYQISIFEIYTGVEKDPYLVLVSEKHLDSEVKNLRGYDLRGQGT